MAYRLWRRTDRCVRLAYDAARSGPHRLDDAEHRYVGCGGVSCRHDGLSARPHPWSMSTRSTAMATFGIRGDSRSQLRWGHGGNARGLSVFGARSAMAASGFMCCQASTWRWRSLPATMMLLISGFHRLA